MNKEVKITTQEEVESVAHWEPGFYRLGVEGCQQAQVKYITCCFIWSELTFQEQGEILEMSTGHPILFHGISPLGDIIQVNLVPYATRLLKKAKDVMYRLRESEFEDDLFSKD